MAESYIDFVFYFVFMSLVVGAICREIKKLTGIPYTPMLLVVGIAWGLCEQWFGYSGESGDFVEKIEPHGILMCIIPAIAFDSGINTDWHTLKKDFGQVLLLAGPGIVIIAILVALIFKYPLGYDQLSWSEVLMIGSILSATDPVAVIAMLKEVGASNKIAVIIDGESLLNDGTAMVFFHVMAQIVKEGSFDVGDVIGLFFRLTLGAWTCGFLFAIVVYYWFRRLKSDSVEATGLTLFASYLLFLLCEGTEVEMSGILAICSMGYFLSGFSGEVISPLVEHPLHEVWSFIGWVAETILFVLAGLIIGGAVLREDHIESRDWPMLLVHFVLLYLTRVVMIGIFYPILKYSGYSINWKNFIIFVHAGLRGGVGLALSLTVWTDSEFSDAVRSIVVFHVSGMAVMTVVLNGCTGKWILEKLGLSDNTGEQELVINDAAKSVISSGDKLMARLMSNLNLAQVDWTKVVERIGTRNMAEEIVSQLTAGKRVKLKMRRSGQSEAELLHEYEETLANVENNRRLTEARMRFLLVLRSRYSYFHERGLCLPSTYVYLIHQNDIARDFVENKLATWNVVEPTVLSSFTIRCLLRLRKVPLIKKFVHWRVYRQIGEAYDRCLAFYTAHEEAWKIFSKALPGLTSQIITELHAEIQREIGGCKHFMARHLLDGYKHIVSTYQERTAAVLILNKIADSIASDAEEGVITEKEAGIISSSVETRLWSMYYTNPIAHFSDMPNCVSAWPLFKEAPKELVTQLHRISTLMLLLNDEPLYLANQPLQYIYLLIHGRVNERNEAGVEFEHEPGGLIGAQFLLSKATTPDTTARADMWVFVRRIPAAGLRELLSTFEKDIWKAAYPVLIMFNQIPGKAATDLSSKGLVRMVSTSKITLSNPGEIVQMPFGGAVIPQIPNVDSDESISRQESKNVILFDPQQGNGVAIPQRAAVIQFNPELYDRWLNSDRDMNRVLRELNGDYEGQDENLGRRATAMSSGRDHDSDDEFLSPKS